MAEPSLWPWLLICLTDLLWMIKEPARTASPSPSLTSLTRSFWGVLHFGRQVEVVLPEKGASVLSQLGQLLVPSSSLGACCFQLLLAGSNFRLRSSSFEITNHLRKTMNMLWYFKPKVSLTMNCRGIPSISTTAIVI